MPEIVGKIGYHVAWMIGGQFGTSYVEMPFPGIETLDDVIRLRAELSRGLGLPEIPPTQQHPVWIAGWNEVKPARKIALPGNGLHLVS